jgi:hypothetical protein
MRVENNNAGSSRGEVETRRRTVESQLLDKDIALYDLTGDWTFAAQCVSSHQHHNPAAAAAGRSNNTSPVSGEKDDAVVGGTSAAAAAAPPSPLKIEQRQDNCTTKSDANNEQTSVARQRRSTNAVYISSRAPFLPTIEWQEKITVDSPRHPLHRVYTEAHALDHIRNAEHNTNSNSTGSRKYFSRKQDDGSASSRGRSVRHVKPSEMEACKEELIVSSQDLVYKTYCRVIDQASSAEPDAAPVFDIPEVISGTLIQDQIVSLAHVLGGEWEPDEAAVMSFPVSSIGRGRRRDRPAAQVFADVRMFFDGLFAAEGPALLDRYRDFIDLKQEERERAQAARQHHEEEFDGADAPQ